jgi:hypothetical protein
MAGVLLICFLKSRSSISKDTTCSKYSSGNQTLLDSPQMENSALKRRSPKSVALGKTRFAPVR